MQDTNIINTQSSRYESVVPPIVRANIIPNVNSSLRERYIDLPVRYLYSLISKMAKGLIGDRTFLRIKTQGESAYIPCSVNLYPRLDKVNIIIQTINSMPDENTRRRLALDLFVIVKDMLSFTTKQDRIALFLMLNNIEDFKITTANEFTEITSDLSTSDFLPDV